MYVDLKKSGGKYANCFEDKDRVALSPSLSIANMSFGLSSSIDDLEGVSDGILYICPNRLSFEFNTHPVDSGLGYSTFDETLVMQSNGKPAPTIMEALFAQKKIWQNVFGLSFAPTTCVSFLCG